MDQRIPLERIETHGRGLRRPECVLCTAAGHLYCADWGGGVTRLGPDGAIERILARDAGFDLKPNGIALCRDGSFLVTDLGDQGGLYRLSRDGRLEPEIVEVEGQRVPPSNFVLIDERERTWLTVSTRREPRALGYRPDVNDGFIIIRDRRGTRIVADGLGYTNEVQLAPDGRWLYVNETFGRRLSRFRLAADGALTARETVAEFGPGTFPDGIAFDARGGIWITSIVSNRVLYIEPGGKPHTVIEDADPDHLAWVEAAFQDGTMGRAHLDRVKSRKLGNISSLAFGGPDLRTVYLGCLLDDRLYRFRSPVPGRKPVHWHWDAVD
jgi:sugar lactone lactonase YvrE